MSVVKILRDGGYKAKTVKEPKIVFQTKKKRKKKPGSIAKYPGAGKYSDSIVFEVYEYARMGMTNKQIQETLGIAIQSMIDWQKKYPLFKMALEEGRKHINGADGQKTFRDYVYKRLDPELRELWDEINACEKERNGVARIEALFRQRGTRARQHLFLYALTASNFNASSACRKVGLSKVTVDGWIENDPEFARLMDEIHWHKGNFFESALVGAVKAGETGAILFANRTFNKGRGYGVKVEHEVSGQINHLHVTVDFESLQLDIDTKRKVLEAIKRQESEQPKLIGFKDTNVIDAEFEEKEAS